MGNFEFAVQLPCEYVLPRNYELRGTYKYVGAQIDGVAREWSFTRVNHPCLIVYVHLDEEGGIVARRGRDGEEPASSGLYMNDQF